MHANDKDNTMIRKPDAVWGKTCWGWRNSFRELVFVHWGKKTDVFGRRKEAESVVEMGVRFVPSSPEWLYRYFWARV